MYLYMCVCVCIYTYTNVYMTCAPLPGVFVFLSLSTDIRLPLSMTAYRCFHVMFIYFRSLYIFCTACRILAHRLIFLFYIRFEIKLILSYLSKKRSMVFTRGYYGRRRISVTWTFSVLKNYSKSTNGIVFPEQKQHLKMNRTMLLLIKGMHIDILSWIRNQMDCCMCDVLSHPCPYFNSTEVRICMCNHSP